jgi:hypothetical protein
MQILQVTLWIYGMALKRALECVRKNLVVSFAPLVYSLLLSAAAIVALPLGILGGLVVGLVAQAVSQLRSLSRQEYDRQRQGRSKRLCTGF